MCPAAISTPPAAQAAVAAGLEAKGLAVLREGEIRRAIWPPY